MLRCIAEAYALRTLLLSTPSTGACSGRQKTLFVCFDSNVPFFFFRRTGLELDPIPENRPGWRLEKSAGVGLSICASLKERARVTTQQRFGRGLRKFGEPIGARRVDRGTIAAIGKVERGTGAVSENADAGRAGRAGTRDRTRRRERGRAEMVFGEGRGRSYARARHRSKSRPSSPPPPACSKKYLSANVSGAFGKMTFEASDGRGDLHGATEHGPVRVDIRETHL